jgi:hypothetical protein
VLHARDAGAGSDHWIGERVERIGVGEQDGAAQLAADAALVPLRIVRDRGGSGLALTLTTAGILGVFLVLTYELQRTLGFSPVTTGLVFLRRSECSSSTQPSRARFG